MKITRVTATAESRPRRKPVRDALQSLDTEGEQRGYLINPIRHYIERTADEVSAHVCARIERADLDELTFAWAGFEQRGQGHYYAIKGPTFLIEYDNTQNDANHIHSVWRDLTHDWDVDMLANHYAHAHGSP